MVHLRVLGGVDLQGSTEFGASGSRLQSKRAALLVFLALAQPRGFHRRDQLLGLFWPELDGHRARNALSQALHAIRRSVGEGVLLNRGEQEVGLVPDRLWCDVHAFEAAHAAGRFAEALELYRGELLHGFFVGNGLLELERWVEEERARLRGMALQAALGAAADDEARGDLPRALQRYQGALAMAPYDEAVLRRTLELQRRLGDHGGVRASFAAFERRLREDLEVEPSDELRRRLRELQSSSGDPQPSFAGEALPEPPAMPPPAPAVRIPPVPRTVPIPATVQRRPRRVASRAITVAAAAISLAAVGTFAMDPDRRPPPPEAPGPAAAWQRSIAVLPFVAPGAADEERYLAEGFADELLQALGRVPGLHVTARSSSFALDREVLNVSEIGRRLSVAYLLEGSVTRTGRTMTVQVRLLRAADGKLVWAENYERGLEDLFELQRDVAMRVVTALEGQPPFGDATDESRKPTEDLLSHEAYLKGRYLWNVRTGEALEKAIASFQESISRDPGYAAPYAGLADASNLLAAMGSAPGTLMYPKARAAALQALAIDSTHAEAAAALAFALYVHDADAVAAEREFRNALEWNPNYAPAHQWYSQMLSLLGRFDEARREMEHARRLDPLSLAIQTDWARDAYFARRYDLAEERLRETLELEPNYARAHSYLAIVHVEQGRLEAAIEEFGKAIELAGGWWPSRFGQAGLSRAYALHGRRNEALEILDELSRSTRYVSPEALALIHTALAQPDAALDELERAWGERAINQGWIGFDPAWDRLRAEPRFSRLLAEMKITAPVPPPQSWLPD